MSYLGLSEDHWMFCDSNGNVYGVPILKADTYGQAYEIAFGYFFG
jgi:uncharacterized protein YuzE